MIAYVHSGAQACSRALQLINERVHPNQGLTSHMMHLSQVSVLLSALTSGGGLSSAYSAKEQKEGASHRQEQALAVSSVQWLQKLSLAALSCSEQAEPSHWLQKHVWGRKVKARLVEGQRQVSTPVPSVPTAVRAVSLEPESAPLPPPPPPTPQTPPPTPELSARSGSRPHFSPQRSARRTAMKLEAEVARSLHRAMPDFARALSRVPLSGSTCTALAPVLTVWLSALLTLEPTPFTWSTRTEREAATMNVSGGLAIVLWNAARRTLRPATAERCQGMALKVLGAHSEVTGVDLSGHETAGVSGHQGTGDVVACGCVVLACVAGFLEEGGEGQGGALAWEPRQLLRLLDVSALAVAALPPVARDRDHTQATAVSPLLRQLARRLESIEGLFDLKELPTLQPDLSVDVPAGEDEAHEDGDDDEDWDDWDEESEGGDDSGAGNLDRGVLSAVAAFLQDLGVIVGTADNDDIGGLEALVGAAIEFGGGLETGVTPDDRAVLLHVQRLGSGCGGGGSS